jgi:hypothetical protein
VNGRERAIPYIAVHNPELVKVSVTGKDAAKQGTPVPQDPQL